MKTPAATQTAADTAPVLTIETKKLGELFLPLFRGVERSLYYMDEACLNAFRHPDYEHLNIARHCVSTRVEELAEIITRRGGLLLIGGAA